MASFTLSAKSAVAFRSAKLSSSKSAKPHTPVARKTLKIVNHCQVPCGIFDDKRVIAKLKEDVTTIRKAQTEMADLVPKMASLDGGNTFSRWVLYKEKHADDIIQEMGYYFMCQRIPKWEWASEEDKMAALAVHHAVMVAAMKAKQGTSTATCDDLDAAIEALAGLAMYS